MFGDDALLRAPFGNSLSGRMSASFLIDWPKPRIDAECSRVYAKYAQELVAHYRTYFAERVTLRGMQEYSAANLKAALARGHESLIGRLQRPHRFHLSGRSSQVLALGILGAASAADPRLTWLWSLLGIEIPAGEVKDEFERELNRKTLNEEPRVTSIDYFVDSPEAVVCAEAKWSEAGMGSCSCARPEQAESEDAEAGEPRFGECAGRIINDRPLYWETAREIFGLSRPTIGMPCPIWTPYQAVRNAAAARALANGRRAVFLLLYDENNPYFCQTGAWPGWPTLLTEAVKESEAFQFRAVSWQRLISMLPLDEETRIWAREKHRLPA
jgi:hypothetical protein